MPIKFGPTVAPDDGPPYPAPPDELVAATSECQATLPPPDAKAPVASPLRVALPPLASRSTPAPPVRAPATAAQLPACEPAAQMSALVGAAPPFGPVSAAATAEARPPSPPGDVTVVTPSLMVVAPPFTPAAPSDAPYVPPAPTVMVNTCPALTFQSLPAQAALLPPVAVPVLPERPPPPPPPICMVVTHPSAGAVNVPEEIYGRWIFGVIGGCFGDPNSSEIRVAVVIPTLSLRLHKLPRRQRAGGQSTWHLHRDLGTCAR